MFKTLIMLQTKSDETAITITTFRYFIAGSSPFILGHEFQVTNF